jgi:hypothetical protein
MKTPKRSGVVAVVVGAVVAAAVVVPNGNAQSPPAPGATTLTFYEPNSAETFSILDNAPKSPVKNPESKKYRFSVGDQVTFSNALFDKAGGTRLGTLYVTATVVKGKTFDNVSLLARGAYVLNNGDQISLLGVFSFATPNVRLPIVGGTGAYNGARGTLASTEAKNSSTDTLTLLP